MPSVEEISVWKTVVTVRGYVENVIMILLLKFREIFSSFLLVPVATLLIFLLNLLGSVMFVNVSTTGDIIFV
jgi:hypothetical protein